MATRRVISRATPIDEYCKHFLSCLKVILMKAPAPPQKLSVTGHEMEMFQLRPKLVPGFGSDTIAGSDYWDKAALDWSRISYFWTCRFVSGISCRRGSETKYKYINDFWSELLHSTCPYCGLAILQYFTFPNSQTQLLSVAIRRPNDPRCMHSTGYYWIQYTMAKT